ncbi:jg15738 [Pararge aegeria aegeria]|uniref:Jg15738 protein n=1 Tax=Pararge aegeria aegeria TaxID=348720 RepID=A0A8S4QUF0_9NEOP|nr:jg15738 [Pararge aegeria aegeria]
MEEDTKKKAEESEEEPSASNKKITGDSNSKDKGDRINNRDNKDEGHTSSDSECSIYSMDSDNEPNTNINQAKMMLSLGGNVNGEAKGRGKKKKNTKKTIAGKVEKKKRPSPRRNVIRRAPKRRVQLGREMSRSTIFSRLSSSGTIGAICHHCGHRCCRRR